MSDHHHSHEKKTSWVVLLTAVTMVVEILYGVWSGSMALLADGIHMGSHVLAIGLSWLAYYYIRKQQEKPASTINENRVLSLAGYTSGLLLLGFAIGILYEAIERFFSPVSINYQEAIWVAIIGLVVNIASVFLLHHDDEHTDHNIKAAYIHVVADAVTSLAAIAGLIAAMLWGISSIDTLAAIISSLVIIKWAVGLLKASGRSLINEKSGHDDHEHHGHGHGHHH